MPGTFLNESHPFQKIINPCHATMNATLDHNRDQTFEPLARQGSSIKWLSKRDFYLSNESQQKETYLVFHLVDMQIRLPNLQYLIILGLGKRTTLGVEP
jgi:hypothetical protein